MRLLTLPFDPEPARERVSPRGPLLQVAAAAGALVGLGYVLDGSDGGQVLGRALQVSAAHGALIAVGFIWTLRGRPGWKSPALRVAGALLLASLLARLTPWGALASVVPVAVLVREGVAQPALGRTGLTAPVGLRALLAGLGAGAFLGSHLLLSASMTLGYAAGAPGSPGYLRALAYDAGANALSAEWVFRGVIFPEWWRRSGFWRAAAGSTGLALVRYLLDPALPRTVEVIAGAIFYLSVLGMVACALRAWSGGLLPGYLAGVTFFAAYRMLFE